MRALGRHASAAAFWKIPVAFSGVEAWGGSSPALPRTTVRTQTLATVGVRGRSPGEEGHAQPEALGGLALLALPATRSPRPQRPTCTSALTPRCLLLPRVWPPNKPPPLNRSSPRVFF